MEALSTAESLLTSVARAESSATFRPRTQHPSFQEPANVQRAKQATRSCSASRWPSWRHFSSWFGSTSRTIRWFGTYLRSQRVARAVLNGHRVQLFRPWQHSRSNSIPNEAPFEQRVVRLLHPGHISPTTHHQHPAISSSPAQPPTLRRPQYPALISATSASHPQPPALTPVTEPYPCSSYRTSSSSPAFRIRTIVADLGSSFTHTR